MLLTIILNTNLIIVFLLYSIIKFCLIRLELSNLVNFCVSGVSTRWYFQRKNNSSIDVFKSLYNLVRFHWVSVLGCSLLTAFFYWLDYIVDFIFVIIVLIQNTDTEVDVVEAITYSSL